MIPFLIVLFIAALVYIPEGLSDSRYILDELKLLSQSETIADSLTVQKRAGQWHTWKTIPYAVLHLLGGAFLMEFVSFEKAACLTLVGVIFGRIIVHPVFIDIGCSWPISHMPVADSCNLDIAGWKFWKWGWDYWDCLTIMVCMTLGISQYAFFGALLFFPSVFYFLY